MKNSALILTLVAILAIGFVVWYMFIRAPKYSGWGSFSAPYRKYTRTNNCLCRNKAGGYTHQPCPCGSPYETPEEVS